MITTYKISIAIDTTEADEFLDFLKKQGHDADINTSTGNYVNGIRTSTDECAKEIMNSLWVKYCDS
jgi:hypothetical protein